MEDYLRILLIDGDEVDRVMARRALQAAGLDGAITDAADGKTGVQLLTTEGFDVALLDHALPDMDGLTALRAIRAAGVTTPIILLTGQGDEQLGVEMMRAGANDYLSKTRLSRDLLGHSVRHAVRLHRAQAEANLARGLTAESEQRFRVMADSAPVLLWVTDDRGAGIYFNQGWLKYTGRGIDQELGAGWAEGIHPEDKEAALARWREWLTGRERFQTEFRLRRCDGSYGWVLQSGAPRFLPDGTFAGFVGSCVDITDLKRGERERVELLARERAARNAAELARAAAQASEQHYRFLAESIPAVVWTALADGRVDYVNRRWLDYTGMSVEESMGNGWVAAMHPDDVPAVRAAWERSLHDGGVFDIELRYRRSIDRCYRWHLVRALPLRDSAKNVVKWFGTGTDIEDQKRTRDAMTFLADASVVLASALNYEATLGSVAKLAVRKVADWCLVDVLGSDGTLQRVAVSHADAAKVELAEELARRYPNRLGTLVDIVNVVHTGTSELYTELTDDVIGHGARDPDHAAVVRSLGLRSLMVVPMLARGRALGTITLATAETERRYGPADLALAEDLARRAAAAVDNALLYREAQAAFGAKDQAVALLDTLLEKAPVGLAFFDKNLRYVRVNETLAQINGIPPADHLGKTTAELLPNVPPEVTEHRRRALATGEPVLNVEVIGGTWADSSKGRAFLVSHYPVRSSTGEILGVGAVVVEITQLRQAEERLRRSEERYRLVSRATNDIIWDWDLTSNHIEWNASLGERVGYRLDEAVPTSQWWRDHIHPDDRRRVVEGIHGVIEGNGSSWSAEYRFRKKNGQYVTFLDRGFVARDRSGKAYRMIGSMLDVTAAKLAEEELQRAKAEADHARELAEAQQRVAEAANQAKDHFLAVLSHELRTPLTPVLSTVQAMESDPLLPPDLRDSLDMIRRNVELEARLIDDLLDLTRISKGKLELHLQTVDAHETLATALDICRSDILDKGLKLEIDLAARQFHVRADSARLHQVFWNLVKNAVKFTPAGGTIYVSTRNEGRQESGVEGRESGVRVEGSERGGANGELSVAPDSRLLAHGTEHLVVEVRDTGIGIETSVLPRIFDAFEQGERSITRKFGGLGLGLAISKALIDMLGGRLTAASPGRGRGATFGVDLAVTKAPTGPANSRKPAYGASPQSDLRILLVDDHLDTALAMRKLLERLGYRITIANTLADALVSYREYPVDLVISDIGLPDGSGLELIRLLKEQRPVTGIALSGFGMEEDVRKSKEAGFYEHLTKPVNFQRLHALIRAATASSGS